MVRVKNRYLLVNILYPTPSPTPALSSKPLPDLVSFRRPAPPHLTVPQLLRALREQVALLYGDYGAGVTQSSLAIKYFSPATSTLIIRCARAHYRLVWAALTLTTHLPTPTDHLNTRRDGRREPRQAARQDAKPGEACVMRVVRVSGTIRKVEEEAIRRARMDIVRAKREGRAGALQEGKEPEDVLEEWLGFGGEKEEDLGVVVDDDEDSEEDEEEDDAEDKGESQRRG